MDSEEIGMTSLIIGAGRKNKADSIDMSAGIIIEKECGEHVQKGDLLLTLYSSSITDFSEANRRALNSITIE